MCDATGLSQRRACSLTGLSLSTCRYEAQRTATDAHLSGRITELALEHRHLGYPLQISDGRAVGCAKTPRPLPQTNEQCLCRIGKFILTIPDRVNLGKLHFV